VQCEWVFRRGELSLPCEPSQCVQVRHRAAPSCQHNLHNCTVTALLRARCPPCTDITMAIARGSMFETSHLLQRTGDNNIYTSALHCSRCQTVIVEPGP
jgi:hypothetical protein